MVLDSIWQFQRRSSKNRYGVGLPGRKRRSHDRDRGTSTRPEASFSTESSEGGSATGTRAERELIRWKNVFSEITYTLEDKSAIRRSDEYKITHEEIYYYLCKSLGTSLLKLTAYIIYCIPYRIVNDSRIIKTGHRG